MTDIEILQKAIKENAFFRSQVKQLMSPYCPKCGVVNDFHVNLYCRKIQALMKGISRLKQQLAEANNKLKNEHNY
jgi:hypothetical protein